MQVVPLAVGFGASALAIGLGTVETLRRPLILTTNREGITYSGSSLWGTNFRFAWDDVASWHFYEWNDPESGDASFVQFDFLDPRKPIKINALFVEVPGLAAFVEEVRDRIPAREELSKIETFRWRAVVTREGLNLTGRILNHVYFRWNGLRSWRVCQKQPDQDENFIQFHFVDDRPPVNVGDAFVTAPTWERLLQAIRSNVPDREAV